MRREIPAQLPVHGSEDEIGQLGIYVEIGGESRELAPQADQFGDLLSALVDAGRELWQAWIATRLPRELARPASEEAVGELEAVQEPSDLPRACDMRRDEDPEQQRIVLEA